MRRARSVLVTVLLILGALSLPAQTLNPGADLQHAISTAAPGAVILLNPGVYSPNGTWVGTLNVNQSVTLQANGAGVSIVLPSSAIFGVQVTTSNVTLSGFAVSGAGWGVYAGNGSSQLSSIVLNNLSVTSSPSGVSLGHGIYVGKVTNAVVDHCTVQNSNVDGIYIDAGSTGTVVINNTITTTKQFGVVVKDTNSVFVAGNTISGAPIDGIIFTGSSFGRVERNVLNNPGQDGITISDDGSTLSTGTYVGKNTATASHAFPGAGIWLNAQSNGSLVYGNTVTGFPENGFDLFDSAYDEIRGNITSGDLQGGIFFYTSAGPTPTNNVIDGNNISNLAANAGITIRAANKNTVFSNFVQGPTTPTGISLQTSANDQVYLNTFNNLQNGIYAFADATSSSYFLNRQLSSMSNYALSPATVTFDDGATVGGNFWFGHTSTAPFTNIIYASGLSNGPYADGHPYTTDALGQQPTVTPVLPSAGSFAAVGSRKTLEWRSAGCSYVDIDYSSATAGTGLVSIAANYPDVGYYNWVVPTVTAASDYNITLTCKNGSQTAVGNAATGPNFTIAKTGLELLSPQGNLRVSGGTNVVVAWAKTGSVGNVNVLYRAATGTFPTTLASNIAGDYTTVTVPAGATSQGGFLVQEVAANGSADSTDGFVTVMGGTAQATGPAGSVNVGTLQRVDWTSIAGSLYVDIDLLSSQGTTNLIQDLPDFGHFNFLVPGVVGSGATVRVTFKSAPTTVITTATSAAFTIAGVNVVAGPPMPVSVAPSSGSGLTQTFTATYDSGGNPISLVYLLVNSGIITPLSCFVQYNPAANTYQLLNDAGTTLSGAVPVGSGSASNSQCTISGAGGGATLSGNNITVKFPITFTSAYAGAQNVFLFAYDSTGQGSGWQKLGTWTVPGTGGTLPAGAIAACGQSNAPCVASLTPANGSGMSGTFTGIFTDPGGAGMHGLGYILFLPTPNIVFYTATGSCLVEYNRISNAMRLINDAGTGWLPGALGIPLNQGGTLTNSHCTLDVTHSSASINGDIMTVTVKVTFAAGFTGQLATFLQAFNMAGQFTSMTQFGNWMAAPAASRPPGPYVVGLSPTSGTGSSTTLTFTAGYTSGVSGLSFVTMLISSQITGGLACQVFYFQASNTLNLVNDAGTAFVSATGNAPGTGGTISNSRCSINTGGARMTISGDNETISVPTTFNTTTFAGTKNVYVNAFDNYGFLSHWVTGGMWTVP